MKKGRILFIHPEAAAYRREFFDILSKHYDITFGFTGGHQWVNKLAESAGWKYKLFRPIRTPWYAGEVTPQILFEIVRPYDIIVSSIITSFPTHFAYPITRLMRKKFITFDELWTWPQTRLGRLLLPYAQHIAQHASSNIVTGSASRNFFITKLKVNPHKLFISPNSAEDMSLREINTTRLETIRKGLEIGHKRVILFLSRFDKVKNPESLIRAFQLLPPKQQMNTLLIMGGDGDQLHYCKDIAKQLGIDNIRFPGYISHSDVHYYYYLADCFVLPGQTLPETDLQNEAWGLVLNEALSLDLPIISTDTVGGSFDLIQNGINGYRIPEKNVPALADAMAKILQEPRFERSLYKTNKRLIRSFSAEAQFFGFKRAIDFTLSQA